MDGAERNTPTVHSSILPILIFGVAPENRYSKVCLHKLNLWNLWRIRDSEIAFTQFCI